jgi:hypothetical protein
MVQFPKPDCSVWPVTTIIQILDVPIPKSDVLVSNGLFSTASFFVGGRVRGASIKAFPLPLLEDADSTNENTHPIRLCELSPTPLSEVWLIYEKFKLWLSEILFVST